MNVSIDAAAWTYYRPTIEPISKIRGLAGLKTIREPTMTNHSLWY